MRHATRRCRRIKEDEKSHRRDVLFLIPLNRIVFNVSLQIDRRRSIIDRNKARCNRGKSPAFSSLCLLFSSSYLPARRKRARGLVRYNRYASTAILFRRRYTKTRAGSRGEFPALIKGDKGGGKKGRRISTERIACRWEGEGRKVENEEDSVA